MVITPATINLKLKAVSFPPQFAHAGKTARDVDRLPRIMVHTMPCWSNGHEFGKRTGKCDAILTKSSN